MVIELDDDEARLLYAVVLEKAQEHFSYANRSELGDRLSTLASRIARTSRELKAENYNYVEVGFEVLPNRQSVRETSGLSEDVRDARSSGLCARLHSDQIWPLT